MREIISPNVKYFTSSTWGILAMNSAIRHPNGIIEIDSGLSKVTSANELTKKFDRMFSDYEEAGFVYPVNTTGLESYEDEGVGSYRFCRWDEVLADAITSVIKRVGAVDVIMKDGEPEYFAHVSRYFRFMRYEAGGEHYPHFDTDFIGPGYRTRYSMIMYFSDCETGELAFVRNPSNGDTSDWTRQATDSEIYLKIKPRVGKIVIFPHDLCHTVLPFNDADKLRRIVRGDLIFTTRDNEK